MPLGKLPVDLQTTTPLQSSSLSAQAHSLLRIGKEFNKCNLIASRPIRFEFDCGSIRFLEKACETTQKATKGSVALGSDYQAMVSSSKQVFGL